MSWLTNTFEVSHSDHKTIRSMEGIRGLAAFLVFIVHYVTLFQHRLIEETFTAEVAAYLRSVGDIGVDLFFVLSGYLIYGMLIKKHRPFKSYFFRRIQRIYPTFLVAFILYLILSAVFPSQSKIPAELGEGLTYVIQNFLLLPGLFDIKPMITVAWSLSYEFFYYLLIPLLIYVLSMRSWDPKLRIGFFVAVSVFFFSYFAIYGGHIRLLMFVSGILLYETVEGEYFKSFPPLGIPAFLLAMYLVYFYKDVGADGRWKHFSLYVLFYIFCLECFVSSGLLTRILSTRPVRWFGNMSYSYYLFHGITLLGFFYVFDRVYPPSQYETILIWLLLPLIFFITTIGAATVFILVEKPYSIVVRK